MNLKLKPYLDVLSNTDEQKSRDSAPARSAESQKRLELKIAQVDLEILTAQQTVTAYASQYPLATDTLVAALDGLALKERQKKQLTEVAAMLFPVASK